MTPLRETLVADIAAGRGTMVRHFMALHPDRNQQQIKNALNLGVQQGQIHCARKDKFAGIYALGPAPKWKPEPVKRHVLDTCWGNGAATCAAE